MIEFFQTPQAPTDITSRGINLTCYLQQTGDTISSCTVSDTTDTLTITNIVINGGLVSCDVTGGVDGTNYVIVFDVTFGSGTRQSYFGYLVVSTS